MTERTVLSGGDAVLPDGVRQGSTIVISGGVIETVTDAPLHEPREGDTVVDCTGLLVCPGFIDIRCSGGNGFSVLEGTAGHIRRMCAFHASHGTTGLLLSPIIERTGYTKLLPRLASWPGRDTGGARVLGIHALGPFINRDRRGLMPLSAVCAPDRGVLDSILDTGNGAIAMMTAAPELGGILDLLPVIADEDIIVSLGYSDARLDETLRAVDYGATHTTSLFNAMNPLHHREPGLAGAALFSNQLSVDIIADGRHVHPWMLGLTIQNKSPLLTCLATGAAPQTGLDEGEYTLMEGKVTLEDGRLFSADDPAEPAGSVLTMDRAVAGMITMVGMPVADAVFMATATPAALLGLHDRKGRLEPGFDADITLLDRRYDAVMTLVGGEMVHDGRGKEV